MQGDCVALPQLRCEIAEMAVNAWHDDIKNGLLWWSDDRRLDKRIRDRSFMREMEARIRHVAENLQQLSGGRLVDRLAPLAAVDAKQRESLANVLDRAFKLQLSPNGVSQDLIRKLDVLLELVHTFTTTESSAVGSEPAEQLRQIRECAGSIGKILAELPRGFWLPRGQSGSIEARPV